MTQTINPDPQVRAAKLKSAIQCCFVQRFCKVHPIPHRASRMQSLRLSNIGIRCEAINSGNGAALHMFHQTKHTLHLPSAPTLRCPLKTLASIRDDDDGGLAVYFCSISTQDASTSEYDDPIQPAQRICVFRPKILLRCTGLNITRLSK